MTQNKIKFATKNKSEFIIELREKVTSYFEANNISKYGNLNLVVKSVFIFSLYLIPYVLMLSGVVNSLAGAFICWFIMGFGKAGVGMTIMHDANHHTYSKNKTTNKWLGKTIYLLGGFPPNWQRQHNTLHHSYTNIDGHDEDISPISLLRFSPHKPLLKIHKYQHFYAWLLYGLMTLLWATTKDFKQLRRYKKDGVALSRNRTYNQLLAILIFSKVIYYIGFLLIPMLVMPLAWFWIIILFLTMHFTSGIILTTIFQLAHVVSTSEFPLPGNKGSMENNWAVHQLLTTSDFSPNNKILSWFIGGLNYQVEHHLFPNISHVHYHKIASMVKAVAHKYNLPYHVQPQFITAVREHTRMLKKLGRV